MELPHEVAAAALAAVKGQQKLQSQVEQVRSRDLSFADILTAALGQYGRTWQSMALLGFPHPRVYVQRSICMLLVQHHNQLCRCPCFSSDSTLQQQQQWRAHMAAPASMIPTTAAHMLGSSGQ